MKQKFRNNILNRKLLGLPVRTTHKKGAKIKMYLGTKHILTSEDICLRDKLFILDSLMLDRYTFLVNILIPFAIKYYQGYYGHDEDYVANIKNVFELIKKNKDNKDKLLDIEPIIYELDVEKLTEKWVLYRAIFALYHYAAFGTRRDFRYYYFPFGEKDAEEILTDFVKTIK